MDLNNKTPPSVGVLEQRPFSELKKSANKHGIKGNLRSSKAKDTSSTSIVSDTSLLDMSNVTISRGSERKLRPRKVCFLSPAKTASTPKNSSVKLRPKTPIPSRKSFGKCASFSSPVRQEKMPVKQFLAITTPSKSSSNEEVVGKTKSLVSKGEASTKFKRMTTPNFKKIHEKAFEKMESIDDYQKRKLVYSARKINECPNLRSKLADVKSKIPAFAGIPFIPSNCNIKSENIITSVSMEDRSIKPEKVVALIGTKAMKNTKENASAKRKIKFDLKASLSRKLDYKPYTGPVKPLAESNILSGFNALCSSNSKDPANAVLVNKRLQTRSVLKGVRINKRFELQMKNRKL